MGPAGASACVFAIHKGPVQRLGRLAHLLELVAEESGLDRDMLPASLKHTLWRQARVR